MGEGGGVGISKCIILTKQILFRKILILLYMKQTHNIHGYVCTITMKNVVFIVPYSLSSLRVSVLRSERARLSISLLQG